MKKRNITILGFVIIILVLFFLGFINVKYNELADCYDSITLRNVYYTLDDILDGYNAEDPNYIILGEEFDKMHTYAWYAQVSPHINVVSNKLDNIADIDYENISKNELEYLIDIHTKLRTFNENINLATEQPMKRMLGVFRKSKLNELEAIFDESSL